MIETLVTLIALSAFLIVALLFVVAIQIGDVEKSIDKLAVIIRDRQ